MNRGIFQAGEGALAASLAGRTILQIIPRLDAGGAERTTIDIAAALVHAGARALVASEGGRLVADLQASGGIFVPFPARTKNPFRMLSNVGRLARLIERERVDLVHARSRAPAWVALAASGRTGRPFVTTYHGDYSSGSPAKRIYNSVMARGDRVIANSHYTSGRILDAYPQAGPRVVVIARGTDLRKFSRNAVDAARVAKVRAQWGVTSDERVVLLPGRLTDWKGQKILIDAAKILRDRGVTGVKYVLAGDPQGRKGYANALEARIKAHDLADCVVLVGHCSDMPAAIVASSAVTSPSTEPEAFGRVAVEAQAMGAPVVVSDLGGARETVVSPPECAASERTGWRVPPGDAGALADSIAEALAMGASARASLAKRARTYVEEHFTLDGMARATLETYADLLAAPRKG